MPNGRYFAAAGLVRSNTSAMGYIRIYNHSKFIEVYRDKNMFLNRNIENKRAIIKSFRSTGTSEVPPHHCIATKPPINDLRICPWNENIFATSHRTSHKILLYDMLKWHDRPFLELTVGRGEKLSQGNNAVCFVPSTKQIVSAGTPVGCLRVWDLRTSRTRGIKMSTVPRYRLGGSADSKFFRSTSPATALCVSSDGRTIYGGNSSGDIVGWDLRCIKTPSFGVRAEPQVTSHFNTLEAAASDNREYVSNSGVDSCIKSMVMHEHGILVYQTNKGYIGTLNVNELTMRGGKTAGLYQLSAVDNVVSLEKTERLRKQREQHARRMANGGFESAPPEGTSYRVASVVPSTSSSVQTALQDTSGAPDGDGNSVVENQTFRPLPKQGHVLSLFPNINLLACTGLSSTATLVFMDLSHRRSLDGKIRQWRRQLVPKANNGAGNDNSNQNLRNVTALTCHPNNDVMVAALGGLPGELVPINTRFGQSTGTLS